MGKNMSISYDQMSSPIGPLTLMTHENRLIRIDFGTIEQVQTKVMTYLSNIGTSIDFKATTIEHAIKQELNEYFLKQRFDFSIEHVFHGTHFQRDVWQALLRIPYGETVSYKQIAEWVGRPKAARAVGGAVNKNPFSIVVPCHRVIGANGQLVGYGGGIERKLFLLDHEKEAKKILNHRICDKHRLHRLIVEGMFMEALKAEWLHFFTSEQESDSWWVRKKKLCEQRNVDMVRIQGEGRMYRVIRYDHYTLCEYLLHITFVMKQNDNDFYIEEQVLPIECRMEDGNIVEHKIKPFIKDKERQSDAPSLREFKMPLYNPRFSYDRRAAVQYAERWWNSYNPVFRQFSVDCTNYVSQCLLAGGAPMRGAPNRNKGWWYQHNEWSYSWSVAHSMRWYLSGSNEGLKGKEVELAEDLNPGDVICYDFQGDDRWDHTTIVVSKDANNMPLVNAHTDNSRHRYWTYEDSTAWTPNIKYKFFQVGQ